MRFGLLTWLLDARKLDPPMVQGNSRGLRGLKTLWGDNEAAFWDSKLCGLNRVWGCQREWVRAFGCPGGSE